MSGGAQRRRLPPPAAVLILAAAALAACLPVAQAQVMKGGGTLPGSADRQAWQQRPDSRCVRRHPRPAQTTSSLWGAAGERWSATGRLADMSYAGYGAGELPIPQYRALINVKSYGAKGDNVTDDSLAFVAAIRAAQALAANLTTRPCPSAANPAARCPLVPDRGWQNEGAAGVAVWVPPGIYRITRMLEITASNGGCACAGAGRRGSTAWRLLLVGEPAVGACSSQAVGSPPPLAAAHPCCSGGAGCGPGQERPLLPQGTQVDLWCAVACLPACLLLCRSASNACGRAVQGLGGGHASMQQARKAARASPRSRPAHAPTALLAAHPPCPARLQATRWLGSLREASSTS